MHPIHGMSMQPIHLPPAAPPPPREGDGKPKSIFSALDPVLDQVNEEGKVNPDGKRDSKQNPSRKKPRKQEASSTEKERAVGSPVPPPSSIDLGVYTSSGKPQTPPPATGGSFNVAA